jgi:hypothetical protein
VTVFVEALFVRAEKDVAAVVQSELELGYLEASALTAHAVAADGVVVAVAVAAAAAQP